MTSMMLSFSPSRLEVLGASDLFSMLLSGNRAFSLPKLKAKDLAGPLWGQFFHL